MATRKNTEFVPSTGDEEYLQPAGSKQEIQPRKDWTGGLGALSLQELAHIADTINDTVEKTEKTVARAQIKVGKELLRARAMFKGDKEFGRWRQEKTYVSKTAATQLMRVAEKFDTAPKLVEAVSFSVLRELVYAPEEAVKQVEAKVEAGEKVTKAKAIDIRKAAQGTTKKATTAFMKKEDDGLNHTPEEASMDMIVKPIDERCRISKNPWDILGLYRFAPVHKDTVEAIEEYYTREEDPFDDDIVRKVIEAAHKIRREISA